jgi:hypothetical protein
MVLWFFPGSEGDGGSERPGREPDHRSPSNAEDKNEWSHISIPSSCPLGVDRYNFTFLSIDVGLLFKVRLSVTINFFLKL